MAKFEGRLQEDYARIHNYWVLTQFYVDVLCLCRMVIIKEFIIVISKLFILIPESIPSLRLDVSA